MRGLASGPVLAVVERNGRVESEHRGLAVGIDRTGQVAVAWGEVETPVYGRSAFKPLQAEAMVEVGLVLEREQLALACASHDGTPRHLDVVRSILARFGLDEAALATPEDLPLDRDAAERLLASGGTRSRLCMNCSGKHAAMLATCVTRGWPVEGYLDVHHPLQRQVLDSIARACGVASVPVGIDGCGAPAPVVALSGLCRAVAAVAVRRGPVWQAMTGAPDLVAGPTRPATRLMTAVPGLMAKDGAEGVFVAALSDGTAVAVKIADGATRAAGRVAARILAHLGVPIPEGLEADLAPAVLGGGHPVGELRVVI